MDHTGKEKPVGVSLRAVVMSFGLLTVTGKGGEDKQESEQETQG